VLHAAAVSCWRNSPHAYDPAKTVWVLAHELQIEPKVVQAQLGGSGAGSLLPPRRPPPRSKFPELLNRPTKGMPEYGWCVGWLDGGMDGGIDACCARLDVDRQAQPYSAGSCMHLVPQVLLLMVSVCLTTTQLACHALQSLRVVRPVN
jgi:hypothetical protein